MSRTRLIREAEPPADVLLGTGRGGYRAGGKEGLHRKVRIGLETSEVTEGEAAPPSVWGLKEAAAPLGGGDTLTSELLTLSLAIQHRLL